MKKISTANIVKLYLAISLNLVTVICIVRYFMGFSIPKFILGWTAFFLIITSICIINEIKKANKSSQPDNSIEENKN